MSEYLNVCQSSFWKDVFREELEYLFLPGTDLSGGFLWSGLKKVTVSYYSI
jgi:hypothetical protein